MSENRPHESMLEYLLNVHKSMVDEVMILKCSECGESRPPELYEIAGGKRFLEQPGASHVGCGGIWGKTDDKADTQFAKVLKEHAAKERLEDITKILTSFHTLLVDGGIDSHMAGAITGMFAAGGLDLNSINHFR